MLLPPVWLRDKGLESLQRIPQELPACKTYSPHTGSSVFTNLGNHSVTDQMQIHLVTQF